jgi:hypothetical protein
VADNLVTNTLEFPYIRSLGPVMGGFLGALRDGRIVGVRTAAGRVLVPPLEYDPETGADVDPTLVEVGPEGTITSWTWVADPSEQHPLDRPFAFALIRLDGADTDLTHVIDAPGPGALSTGARVRPRWRAEADRMARIDAIEAFELIGGQGGSDD